MKAAKWIIVGVIVIAIIMAGVAAKRHWFPAVKDAWFHFDLKDFRSAPVGLTIVRPTHFPLSLSRGVNGDVANGVRRVMGRNITLQQLMAIAYECSASRVIVPAGTPTNRFDFLITFPTGKAPDTLKQEIQKQLGYVGEMKTQETEVLDLKVVTANSPGLVVSDAAEKPGVRFVNGFLNFKHMTMGVIAQEVEGMLNQPVVDKSGLTQSYDYSIAWTGRMQRMVREQNVTRERIDQILSGWGLGLEEDTETVNMLVVEKKGR